MDVLSIVVAYVRDFIVYHGAVVHRGLVLDLEVSYRLDSAGRRRGGGVALKDGPVMKLWPGSATMHWD